MKFEKLLAASAVSVALLSSSASALTLDGGWESDTISDAGTPSSGSPYAVSLTDSAYFRITDAFITGDVFDIFIDGVLAFSTTFTAFGSGFGDNPTADSAWTSASYSSGEYLLAAGDYSITVQGDGAGGLPAGFYTRLDSVSAVPLPAAAPLLLAALGGLGFARRRKNKAA
ncbi:VPLPA-CTERM sorting domain-containing protein [Celeribacter neptunius]|uniref:VPLPA-CTERM protein sorting domain-containing protein n=1 Tax=Celeribacter neptunius TaxID=588602 RepID=A0A1I3JUX5_9RHOB|nr:VPLPA-CTERM sorting domain-containing protein [Celeribacter neptunius]SFI63818.1 VPLPA-CTERM protein sorting domain-containing protein [Celeribacter neptunius]